MEVFENYVSFKMAPFPTVKKDLFLLETVPKVFGNVSKFIW